MYTFALFDNGRAITVILLPYTILSTIFVTILLSSILLKLQEKDKLRF